MDVCRLYTNTINVLFYVRDLSILVFWWLWWSRHCDPEDSKGWQYLLWHLTHHRERKQWCKEVKSMSFGVTQPILTLSRIINRIPQEIFWGLFAYLLHGKDNSTWFIGYEVLWDCAQSPSCAWLFATPWTVACQASLSLELSRQEYCSRLPFPT